MRMTGGLAEMHAKIEALRDILGIR